MKLIMMTALVAAAGTPALAKDRATTDPMVVQVIGNGAIDLKASGQKMTISYSGRGKTTAAAEAARARKEADVLTMLAASGVPADKITALSATEQAKLSLTDSMDDMVGDDDAKKNPAVAEEVAHGGRTIEVATLAQVDAVTAKLKAMDVDVGEPMPTFGDIAAARRDARLAALTDARAGAERYATALGVHVGPVRRVSETGDGYMLPALQEKVATLLETGDPGPLQRIFEGKRESVKVEEAVVVEFAMQP